MGSSGRPFETREQDLFRRRKSSRGFADANARMDVYREMGSGRHLNIFSRNKCCVTHPTFQDISCNLVPAAARLTWALINPIRWVVKDWGLTENELHLGVSELACGDLHMPPRVSHAATVSVSPARGHRCTLPGFKEEHHYDVSVDQPTRYLPVKPSRRISGVLRSIVSGESRRLGPSLRLADLYPSRNHAFDIVTGLISLSCILVAYHLHGAGTATRRLKKRRGIDITLPEQVLYPTSDCIS